MTRRWHHETSSTTNATDTTEEQTETIVKDAVEQSSIDYGTISWIADVHGSGSIPNSLGTPCECGLQRKGIWFPVVIKFDSAASDNVISDDLIERAGLERFLFEAEYPASFKVSKFTVNMPKKIKLNWQRDQHMVSYTTEFWVQPETDNLDIIIGEPWLKAHGYDFSRRSLPAFSLDVKSFIRFIRATKG